MHTQHKHTNMQTCVNTCVRREAHTSVNLSEPLIFPIMNCLDIGTPMKIEDGLQERLTRNLGDPCLLRHIAPVPHTSHQCRHCPSRRAQHTKELQITTTPVPFRACNYTPLIHTPNPRSLVVPPSLPPSLAPAPLSPPSRHAL